MVYQHYMNCILDKGRRCEVIKLGGNNVGTKNLHCRYFKLTDDISNRVQYDLLSSGIGEELKKKLRSKFIDQITILI